MTDSTLPRYADAIMVRTASGAGRSGDYSREVDLVFFSSHSDTSSCRDDASDHYSPAARLVPNADLIAVLINPTFPVSAAQLKDAQEAAAAVGVRTMALQASAENECEPAFATLVAHRAGTLMIAADRSSTAGASNW